MNGEVKQMSNIVISARKALYEDGTIQFVPYECELTIKFAFAPKVFFVRPLEADSVRDWFNVCKRRGLHDIKFFVPSETIYRPLLGFANSSRGVIVCFWKNGKESYFAPKWEFDNVKKGWNIVYTEHRSEKMFGKQTALMKHTEEFKTVLSKIEKFATDINFPQFSDIFHKAHEALSDRTAIEPHRVPAYVPDEFKGIYYALDTADVFGAMGSWNDSPAYYARVKGVEKEYNRLSDKLLQQIHYHLMYVSNECWK